MAIRGVGLPKLDRRNSIALGQNWNRICEGMMTAGTALVDQHF